jgi:hypothetical protein
LLDLYSQLELEGTSEVEAKEKLNIKEKSKKVRKRRIFKHHNIYGLASRS